MNKERNQFLTEAMGEKWYNLEGRMAQAWTPNTDFSTWEGFGKLWEWANQQKWWGTNSPFWAGYSAYKTQGRYKIGDAFINPDRFADAVYEYLKGG